MDRGATTDEELLCKNTYNYTNAAFCADSPHHIASSPKRVHPENPWQELCNVASVVKSPVMLSFQLNTRHSRRHRHTHLLADTLTLGKKSLQILMWQAKQRLNTQPTTFALKLLAIISAPTSPTGRRPAMPLDKNPQVFRHTEKSRSSINLFLGDAS